MNVPLRMAFVGNCIDLVLHCSEMAQVVEPDWSHHNYTFNSNFIGAACFI